MPIENDDESTQFDARPWGAQQRLLPRANFTAQRISGTLQETSIPQIPSLPGLAPMPRKPAARMTTAPANMPVAAPARMSVSARLPVAAPARMPVGTPAAAVPVAHLAHGSNVAPLPVMAMSVPSSVPVPVPVQPVPSALSPMFSPSLAATMPVFTAPVDSTYRVYRPVWTLRTFIAVPLGALAAILLIVVGYRASSVSPRTSGAVTLPAAVSAQPLTAPVLTPDHYVPPVADGVASFDAPAAVEPTLAPAAEPPVHKPSRKHASSKKRPRKIVAVDSSTPLGNLRVSRYK